MKKLKLLSLLLIITLFAAALPVPALAVAGPEVWSQNAVVMDTATGNVLFDKNGSASVEAGSITVLMTALLTGEAVERQDISLDSAVTATETMAYNLMEGSVLSEPGITVGETLTVEDLLYMTLFRNAQDSSNVLAEYVGGSIDAFVASMNARAAELGCAGTHFSNANGVSAPDNVTTAADVALIARAAFGNGTLRGIFQAANHTTDPTEVNAPRTLGNPSALLNAATGMSYEYATAGHPVDIPIGSSIVAAATYNEIATIAVGLGAPDDASRYSDAITMFQWVYDNYSFRTLLSSTDIMTTVPVEMGDQEAVGVRAETAIRTMCANDEEMGEITYEISYQHEAEGTTLVAPIEVGMYLGDVTVYMNGVNYGTSRLVAGSSVDISRAEYLRSQLETLSRTDSVRQIIKILVIVLGVYLLLVCVYLLQRVRHLHSLRKARRERAKARAQQEVEWLDIPAEVVEQDGPAGYIQQGNAAPEEPYDEADPPAGEDQEAYDEDGGFVEEDPEAYDGDGGFVEEDQEAYDEDGGFVEEGQEAYDGDGGFVEEDQGAYDEDGGFVEDDGYYDGDVRHE